MAAGAADSWYHDAIPTSWAVGKLLGASIA
jgi:hypothetical protein